MTSFDTTLSQTLATIAALPKVELHVHLEGCIPPQLALDMAARNGITLPYTTVEQIDAAKDYGIPHLQNFLAFHYAMFSAVRTAHDVEEIATSFFQKSLENNVRHVEVYFCLQDYLDQGIPLDELIRAMEKARDFATARSLSVAYIYGANRGLSPEDACARLELLDAYPGFAIGVGTCSEETGHPPVLFTEFFRMAAGRGYRITSHCDCDQENSLEHIRQCIQDLPVERIDHGINILESPELMREAAAKGIHFVMTPSSRPSDSEPRRTRESLRMAEGGLSVSFGTDDPEEFSSGYMTTMLQSLVATGPLTLDDIVMFLRNGIDGSWADESLKASLRAELDTAVAQRPD